MDTKSLSSKQVCWAQELSRYHFQIDYHQGGANTAANALLRFPQKSQDKKDELQAENCQVFHCLQNSPINASLAGLSLLFSLLSQLHQVFIYGTYVLPQLRHFWDGLQRELASEGSYKTSIGGMRLRLQELQSEDEQAQKLRAEQLVKDWQDIEGVLHHQGLPYVPEIIRTELISRHHDNPLAGHFGIKKTRELVARKYYWLMFRHNVNNYMKECDVCLALKAVRHKPYSDLQSLPIPTHCWKDLSINFVTGLLILTDWKGDSYNSIFIIVNCFIKMVCYKPVQVTINTPGLAVVIIDIVIKHHGLPDTIITDRGSFFTSKFWSSLYYFLGIKLRLSTAFHPQTNGQTERQNSTMEAYFQAFVNFEQNDWA